MFALMAGGLLGLLLLPILLHVFCVWYGCG